MPPRTLITDTTDFLDEAGQPATGSARKLTEFLGTIIMVASLVHEQDRVQTGIPCRARPQRRPCPGRLSIFVAAPNEELTSVIVWRCPSCGESGEVSKWEGTLWDLSHEREDLRAVAAELEQDGPGGDVH